MGVSISPTKYNESGYFKKNKKYPDVVSFNIQNLVNLSNENEKESCNQIN